MATKERVLTEIDKVPAEYYDILLNFINALKNRPASSAAETALMSESSLAKDWLKPEEDEAWANL